MIQGPKPIYLLNLNNNYNLINELFTQNNQNNQLNSMDFGADQVILVRDNEVKQEVLSISKNHALVLTVHEAKGMEFTNCLIYNFFTTSLLQNDWRLLYHTISNENNSNNNSNKSISNFDSNKHNILNNELKLLYVLLTRAKQHLVIYDENYEYIKVLLELCCNKQLIEKKPIK